MGCINLQQQQEGMDEPFKLTIITLLQLPWQSFTSAGPGCLIPLLQGMCNPAVRVPHKEGAKAPETEHLHLKAAVCCL